MTCVSNDKLRLRFSLKEIEAMASRAAFIVYNLKNFVENVRIKSEDGNIC